MHFFCSGLKHAAVGGGQKRLQQTNWSKKKADPIKKSDKSGWAKRREREKNGRKKGDILGFRRVHFYPNLGEFGRISTVCGMGGEKAQGKVGERLEFTIGYIQGILYRNVWGIEMAGRMFRHLASGGVNSAEIS